jgi:hypothetical protein
MMIDRPGGVALFARSPAIASALTFSPSTSRCFSRLVATAVAISASSEIPAPGLAGYPRRYPGAPADGKIQNPDQACEIIGGRTRTRTSDPLIESKWIGCLMA